MKTYTRIVDELLLEKKRSRSWLASEINISRQALNNHWKEGADGSLPTHIIESINEKFNINLYAMRTGQPYKAMLQEKDGVTLTEPSIQYEKTIQINLTQEEIRQIILQRDSLTENVWFYLAELQKALIKEGIYIPVPGPKRDKTRAKKESR